jgi:hypothetical protein
MFASKSLLVHLSRGAVGLLAFAASIRLAESEPWSLWLTLPVALIALRGCPMCWTVGLIQTVAAKLAGRSSDACSDGSCAR